MKNEPKTNPISEKPKMSLNFYSTKDYEDKPPRPTQKNEPKTNPIQTQFRLPQSLHPSQLPTGEIKRVRYQWNEDKYTLFTLSKGLFAPFCAYPQICEICGEFFFAYPQGALGAS